ncbi:2-(1,2-epoxy-1,2-dihydrophenyl)acetyl-CoA isomerase [Geomicrobium halophilum]|uniref:2-(1,2-epoxy-1,2-dihydrophenyl)acetyl-CoA isomerase n=1 Tax=Geomicrobium halophilum TaxID=549000 RepID=A0A841PN22_9BACL|nr:enoyl-CoA hydratase [Geomicrobium halophilum]MBB6450149.1 2-(1,2-epoxy-1,2-dihydrophenyl)acetyl-CoA isomerase [Geomicrobium halophilum]
MSVEDLQTNLEQSVLTLTLHRPDQLNAFSGEMIEELTKSVKEAETNEDVRVIVITGAGRSFSAGGDVKTMGESEPQDIYAHIGRLNDCISAIKNSPKPVIAAVHGFAAGAGFNLALACDLIVAAEDSKFALSFSKVGLISDGGGSYFLPRLIGPHLAKQFFFSGQSIPAKRLYELGVVNELYPANELQDKTMAMAVDLANGPSVAYGMMKKLVDHAMTASLDEILEQERITQTMMVTTEDHKEGVAAFKEKRAPQFKGK